MLLCEKCGNRLTDSAEFCAHCGHTLASARPQYATPQPPPQQIIHQQKVVVETGGRQLGPSRVRVKCSNLLGSTERVSYGTRSLSHRP
jgi:hypothetical protein